jgi:hypothetical protein
VFFPALLSRLPSNRFSLSSRQTFGSCFAAFDSALPSCIYLGRILPAIRVWRGNLLGSHIYDKFGELVRVAWALAFADCHAIIMPQAGCGRYGGVDFKL